MSIVISILCLLLIIFFFQILRKPFIISPVSFPFSVDYAGDEKYLEQLERILQEKRIQYSSINKFSNSISIKLTNSSEVIISSEKDLNTEISSLQYLLSRLTMEGKDFSRLDLRFDKPVIVLR